MDTKNNSYPNLVTQTNSQAVLVKIILLDHKHDTRRYKGILNNNSLTLVAAEMWLASSTPSL